MKESVISFSGGMDSSALLLDLLSSGYRVHCITFKYSQKHIIEVERAKSNIGYLGQNGFSDKLIHKVISIEDVFSKFNSSLIDEGQSIPEGYYEEESMISTFVPNRNAIFSSIIYGYSLSLSSKKKEKIILGLGVHAGDHSIYPDCRPDFYELLESAFKKGNWGSELLSFYLPFINDEKHSILKKTIVKLNSLGLDFKEFYRNTITSYNPDIHGKSDGKSGADVERILSFNKLGLVDPIEYTEAWPTVLERALSVESSFKEKSL
ncbi:MAG: hypothetical protein CBD58_00305 [bacterium TMED198]|nr:MAG: hypothetical protein CBD58_00305 [bacterium TMED198]